MRAYILTYKHAGSCSHEIYVIMASGKKELYEIAEKNHLDIRQFDIEEKNKPGLIYTDIY